MNEQSHTGLAPETADFGEPYGHTESRKNLRKMIRTEIEERFGPRSIEKPLPAEPIALDEQVHASGVTEALLNAQLLECVGMVRDAGYLYRNSIAEPMDRGHFIHQTAQLMEISTRLADSISRLRGAPEPVKTTRHVVAVEYVERGEGPAKLENE